MILSIYLGEQLGSDLSLSLFFETLFSSIFFYAGIILLILLFIFLYFFLLKPVVYDENPEKLYKRYLVLRDEMSKIDDLFLMKEITYEDYVYAQFGNAKEYEQIVLALSKNTDYKDKLKANTLAHSKERDIEEKKLYKTSFLLNRKIELLCEILAPQARYYTKEEIRQGVLDQGYGINIADKVISKLQDDGVSFGTESKQRHNKISSFINTFFGSKTPDVEKNNTNKINNTYKKNNQNTQKAPKEKNINDSDKKDSFNFEKQFSMRHRPFFEDRNIHNTNYKKEGLIIKDFVKDFNSNVENVPISDIKFKNKETELDKKVHISKFKFIENKKKKDDRFFSTVFKKKKINK